jgi:hypothetical protein
MKFEEIKNLLTSTERQVIDLRNEASSEDANATTRFELKALIERRVNAFVELINNFSTEQYLEVCDALREARA